MKLYQHTLTFPKDPLPARKSLLLWAEAHAETVRKGDKDRFLALVEVLREHVAKEEHDRAFIKYHLNQQKEIHDRRVASYDESQ